MSMPVGGGGGVRPLGPTTQQPQVQQPREQTTTQAPQQPGTANAGQTLNNVNNFSSTPVSTDMAHLQQWLNKIKSGKQPTQKTTQNAPTLSPESNRTQQAQQTQQTQQTTRPNIPASLLQKARDQINPPDAAPIRQELSADQEQRLETGLNILSKKTGINKVKLAQLAHARATGNDSLYFFQLGSLNLPPGSPQLRQVENGLGSLFKATGASKQAVSNGLLKTVVAHDVARLAKSLKLPPTLATDLAALTHNERKQFHQLAQAMGLNGSTTNKLLQGFQDISRQYGLKTPQFDDLMGANVQAANTKIAGLMKQSAQYFGVTPQTFSELANAVLKRDSQAFAALARKANLSTGNTQQLAARINDTLKTLNNPPAITQEKLMRYTANFAVQSQIESLGQQYGISGDQALRLAASYTEGGIHAFSDQARQYNLGQGATGFLRDLETLERNKGTGAIALSTSNIEELVEERQLIRDLQLQPSPLRWNPSTQPTSPFSFFGDLNEASGTPQTTNNRPVNPLTTFQEHRFVKLTNELKKVNGTIQKLEGNPIAWKIVRDAKARKADIQNQLVKLRALGINPSPERSKELALRSKLTSLKNQLAKEEGYLNKIGGGMADIMRSKMQPRLNSLKQQIRATENQLRSLNINVPVNPNAIQDLEREIKSLKKTLSYSEKFAKQWPTKRALNYVEKLKNQINQKQQQVNELKTLLAQQSQGTQGTNQATNANTAQTVLKNRYNNLGQQLSNVYNKIARTDRSFSVHTKDHRKYQQQEVGLLNQMKEIEKTGILSQAEVGEVKNQIQGRLNRLQQRLPHYEQRGFGMQAASDADVRSVKDHIRFLERRINDLNTL